MKGISLITIILTLALFGCKDNPTGDGNDSLALSLKVVDSTNTPIANVSFQYIFYVGEDVVYRNAAIRYSLASPDTVTLCIYDPFQTLIATLVDHQFQQPGTYVQFYDGSALTNGVYEYRISRSSSTTTGRFILLTDDIAKLDSLPPLAKTDQAGTLTIEYSTLGIGSRFTQLAGTDSVDMVVSDTITILLQKSGYQDYLVSI